MRKRFFKNILITLCINALIKPFWIFGIDRQVQNLSPAADYGLYYALLGLSFLFAAVLDMGTTGYNGIEIAQNPTKINQNLATVLPLRFVLFCAYILLTVAAGWSVGYAGSALVWLVLLGINQGLAAFGLYLRSYVAGLQQFKTDAIFSVLDKFLMIILCAPLLYIATERQALNIHLFILIQTVCYAAAACIMFYFLYQKMSDRLHFYFDAATMRNIIKKTLPFALLALLMGLYTKLDVVMIERLLPNGKFYVGVYASGYRLLDAANMFAVLVGGVLYPMFGKMLQNKQNYMPLAHFSGGLVAVATGVVAVVSWYFSDAIMGFLYDKNSPQQAQIFVVLMCAFVPMALVYVYGTLLTAAGKLKYLNIVAGAGLIVNILLNFYLIPKYQALGAAYAAFFTQIFVVSCHFVGCLVLYKKK